MIDISDIMKSKDNSKTILDSADKIIRWINFKLLEQNSKNADSFLNYQYIDLSNCIINTASIDGKPSLTNLYDIIGMSKDASLFCSIKDECTNLFQEVRKAIICKNSIVYSAFFQQTRFMESVNFKGTEFKGYASFSNCVFEKNANFESTIYSGNFSFDFCNFNDSVWFNKAKFNIHHVDFSNSKFHSNFDAQQIEFKGDLNKKNNLNIEPYIKFHNSLFEGKVNLSYNNFTRKCFFNNATFESAVELLETTFHENIYLDDSQINGTFLFSVNPENQEVINKTSLMNAKKISLNRAKVTGRLDIEYYQFEEVLGFFLTIEEGAIMRIFKSSIGSINLTSFCNKGVFILEFNVERIKNLILSNAINFGIIETEGTKIQNISDRRTARILKDSALKLSNNIDALEFRKEEMRLLKMEKKANKQKLDFPLWLNGISNNHNTEWKKGIWFTFKCWIIFYLLFLFTSRLQDIWVFISGGEVNWIIAIDLANSIKYLWSINFLEILSDWIIKIDIQKLDWVSFFKLVHILLKNLN